MPERTEDAALRGVLPIAVGTETVELRVLTFDETDAWLDRTAEVISALEVEDSPDPGMLLGSAMRAGSEAALRTLRDYDRDGKLGDDIRSRLTPSQLREALEAVYSVALPFDAGSARLTAAAFGGPTRYMTALLTATMSRLGSSPERSMPMPSDTGVSATSTSGGRGRRSSSSSGGRTRRTPSAETGTVNGMSSPMP
jgi:hypothetical protein